MHDLLDDNNFFIFDDVNVRISHVSKMPFRKSLVILYCPDLTLDHRFGMFKAYDGQSCSVDELCEKVSRNGLPKMKFEKDHLCSACKQGKIHRKHHKSKMAFASNKPLYLLHMDLCGPMRIQSINGKRYVLVVVDDYSWYTCVFFLHLKDEASKNKTLAKFFDEVGITQQFSAARTPQQNGVVERRNRTLVEAARTMLTFANLPSFL
nr:hypothetical protein [Tanacetum cinerariifolium]